MEPMSARQLALSSLLTVGLMVGTAMTAPVGVALTDESQVDDYPAAPDPSWDSFVQDDDASLCFCYGLFCPFEA